MAKGSNPAEAARKSLKAKEKKRNKETRDSQREKRQSKLDLSSLQSDISTLQDAESRGSISSADKSKLKELRKEFKNIESSKEKVKSAKEKQAAEAALQQAIAGPSKPSKHYGNEQHIDADIQHLFKKDGKLKNPKKSVYYDPVFNPFGVPPPGMPYRERSTPLDDEDGDDGSDSDDYDIPDEEDVVMAASNDSQQLVLAESIDILPEDIDIDSIPMPDDPPPPKGPITADAERVFVDRPLMRFGDPSLPAPPPGGPPIVNHAATHAVPQVPVQQPRQVHTLPLKPGAQPVSKRPQVSIEQAKAQASISAEPQLRDFKKEATSLVPAALQRRRPANGPVDNTAEVQQEAEEE